MATKDKQQSQVEVLASPPQHEQNTMETLKPEAEVADQEKRINTVSLLQVLGAFCLNLNTWGMLSSYGAFQTEYLLGPLRALSSFQVAWIGSVQAFLLFMISLFTGPWFDDGHLRVLLVVGALMATFGLFMTSLCTQFWQFLLAQGFCMGIGFGLLYLPAIALVSQHVHKHKALALTFTSTGSAIGGIIYPIILSHLSNTIGLSWSIRVLGFISGGLYIIPVSVLRYPKGSKQLNRSPPPSKTNISNQLAKYFKKLFDPSITQDKPYLILVAGLLAMFMGYYVILYYIELFAVSRIGVSLDTASNMLVILNASSILSRIVLAILADLLGPVYIMTCCTFVAVFLVFCLLAIRSSAGLIVWAVVTGAVYGTSSGLIPAGIISASNMKVAKVGARFGFSLAVVGCGVLISGPIAGAILGRGENGWDGLISWSGSLFFVATAAFFFAKIAKLGWSVKKQM